MATTTNGLFVRVWSSNSIGAPNPPDDIQKHILKEELENQGHHLKNILTKQQN